MTLAIVFYDVVLFVHIVAVVVAFGVTFTYPLIYAVALPGPARDAARRDRRRGWL